MFHFSCAFFSCFNRDFAVYITFLFSKIRRIFVFFFLKKHKKKKRFELQHFLLLPLSHFLFYLFSFISIKFLFLLCDLNKLLCIFVLKKDVNQENSTVTRTQIQQPQRFYYRLSLSLFVFSFFSFHIHQQKKKQKRNKKNIICVCLFIKKVSFVDSRKIQTL